MENFKTLLHLGSSMCKRSRISKLNSSKGRSWKLCVKIRARIKLTRAIVSFPLSLSFSRENSKEFEEENDAPYLECTWNPVFEIGSKKMINSKFREIWKGSASAVCVCVSKGLQLKNNRLSGQRRVVRVQARIPINLGSRLKQLWFL